MERAKVLFPHVDVVPRDGNAARRHADGSGNGDSEELHHDVEHGKRDLRKFWLSEHIERDAQRDIKKGYSLGVMENFFVDGTAEQGEDRLAENEANRRQRENGRVGCVAVGAEVVRVGNEDLIDDVIKRADEQRDNAGDSVPDHNPAFG